MSINKSSISNRNSRKKGRGLGNLALSAIKGVANSLPLGSIVNRAIDAIPIELHLPGYRYCGPGTKLEERLNRKESGINKLDEACKLHDIAYANYSDSERRSIADEELAGRAWQRVKSSDASLGERAASLAVAAAMKAKRAVGGGRRRRTRSKPKKGGGRRPKRKTGGNKKKRQPNTRSQNGRGLYLRPYRNVY